MIGVGQTRHPRVGIQRRLAPFKRPFKWPGAAPLAAAPPPSSLRGPFGRGSPTEKHGAPGGPLRPPPGARQRDKLVARARPFLAQQPGREKTAAKEGRMSNSKRAAQGSTSAGAHFSLRKAMAAQTWRWAPSWPRPRRRAHAAWAPRCPSPSSFWVLGGCRSIGAGAAEPSRPPKSPQLPNERSRLRLELPPSLLRETLPDGLASAPATPAAVEASVLRLRRGTTTAAKTATPARTAAAAWGGIPGAAGSAAPRKRP